MIIKKEHLEMFAYGERIYIQNSKGLKKKEMSAFNCVTIMYAARGSGYFACGNNRLADEAVMHIRHRIYAAPRLNEIAEQCCVSLGHLDRIFKNYMSMTITQYTNKYRVEKVADILQNMDRPIAGLAKRFNCRDKYLRKIFKKYTSMTMREYRGKYHYKK